MTRPHPDDLRELLPAYVARTVTPEEHRQLDTHLATCPECRSERDAWAAVQRGVATEAPVPAPRPDLVVAVLTAAGPHRAAASRRRPIASLRFAAHLLGAQLALVHRHLWAASAVVTALGVGLAAVAGRGSAAVVLSLVAPMVSAAGLAAVFGSGANPALEVARATPTSPSLVVLARMTVVFGYNLLLAVGGSVVLAAVGVGSSLPGLVDSWLGPMALLSALSLLIAVIAGVNTAIAVAVSLWTARVASGAGTDGSALLGAPLSDMMLAVWTTSGFTLALAAALAAAAVAAAPNSAMIGSTQAGWGRVP